MQRTQPHLCIIPGKKNIIWILTFRKHQTKSNQGGIVAQLVKESACSAGDLGSIPGLGRSAGEGKGYLLQYSGLENSGSKSQTRLSDVHFLQNIWRDFFLNVNEMKNKVRLRNSIQIKGLKRHVNWMQCIFLEIKCLHSWQSINKVFRLNKTFNFDFIIIPWLGKRRSQFSENS